jgi:ATP-dependent DNA helicase RecG
MVESWGRGISKILEECTLAGLPKPYFDLEMGGVDVRFSPRAIKEMSVETT